TSTWKWKTIEFCSMRRIVLSGRRGTRRPSLGPEEITMPSKPWPAHKTQILMSGIAMGESPRWHENRLWFSDWGAQEIIAVDLHGKSEVMVQVSFGLPFCIDWLRDGRLLVVSGREGLLFRRERDGSLATHADLHGFAGMGWNEIVVDGRGNVYINGGSG